MSLHMLHRLAKSLWRTGAMLVACAGLLSSAARAECTLAFTNVAVVPMDREVVVPGQTVVIDHGLIAAIGPVGSIDVRGCASVVNGTGKYLLPGLIDAHVHVESLAFAEAFGIKSEPIDFEDVLALYPAYGVTSVRVMSGAPDILAFRDGPHSQNPVPRLVVASPMLAGSPPILPPPVTRVIETPAEARAAVQEYVKAGYDLIKVRENLREDVFRAVADEARRLSIDVDGHITRAPTVAVPDLILAGQRGFAHLDEIARAMDADGGRRRGEIVRLLKQKGVYISTTMIVLKNAAEQIADFEKMAARPEARFLHPLLTRSFWAREQNPYSKAGADRAFFLQLLEETKRALKLLTDNNVRILAGTDAMNPMIIPGMSLHEELQLMVDAGLTPYQAIRTATISPAHALRRLSNAGVLAAGKDSDVILVAGNPLRNVAALMRPEGVAVRGQWFDRKALDARLEAVAAKYRSQ